MAGVIQGENDRRAGPGSDGVRRWHLCHLVAQLLCSLSVADITKYHS